MKKNGDDIMTELNTTPKVKKIYWKCTKCPCELRQDKEPEACPICHATSMKKVEKEVYDSGNVFAKMEEKLEQYTEGTQKPTMQDFMED